MFSNQGLILEKKTGGEEDRNQSRVAHTRYSNIIGTKTIFNHHEDHANKDLLIEKNTNGALYLGISKVQNGIFILVVITGAHTHLQRPQSGFQKSAIHPYVPSPLLSLHFFWRLQQSTQNGVVMKGNKHPPLYPHHLNNTLTAGQAQVRRGARKGIIIKGRCSHFSKRSLPHAVCSSSVD